ncbi:hypothetical protein [Cryobacterium sp. BB736]|uniref:hypothetical protein n=1 Tax=Cryobacterium sp. BB736 TaxID=2746963 RepID=UPI001876D4E9|nr:hypothetical protein [Cryobacterium sp. BB736]
MPDTDGEIGVRQLKWIQKLHDYEHFTTVHGRRPRESTRAKVTLPAPERRMGEWARYQRRNRQLLRHYQVARLTQSPAFAWDPQSADWHAALQACRQYVIVNGRLPYLNSADRAEFTAARWLARQLRQLQDGTLLPDRAEELQGFLRSYDQQRR